tara:strand:- start:5441 stop:6343 length:903 start_codon:yes stop_codon:yes gene_type:complete
MDMDSEIINQNMDADGMQSIHINGDEAELLEILKEQLGTVDNTDNRDAISVYTDPERSKSGWGWTDMQTLLPLPQKRFERQEVFMQNPNSTSGLAYVDARGSLTTDTRGNRTPEHLQRQQDDILSYQTSQMANNAIESYRASLPRETQSKLSGSVFVEQGRDGKYSMFTGTNKTGFVELTYGNLDENYFDALGDVKKMFSHAYNTGDTSFDAGMTGRSTSAGRYKGETDAQLNDAMMTYYNAAKNYMTVDPSISAESLSKADEIGDEMKRRKVRPEIVTPKYSRRVLTRDAKRRAQNMMR